jgi:hypothetical protein
VPGGEGHRDTAKAPQSWLNALANLAKLRRSDPGGVDIKKTLVLLALAAVCEAIAAGSAPSAATPNTVVRRTPADRAGPYDFAVGDAERSADVFAARHVAFTAHKSPRGVWGTFTSQTADVTFTSIVTCLRVDANRAVIGAVIRQSPERPDLQGSLVFVAVEDNGSRSGVTPDRVSAYLFSGPPDADTCDSATVLYGSLAPVTSGNVSVNANT